MEGGCCFCLMKYCIAWLFFLLIYLFLFVYKTLEFREFEVFIGMKFEIIFGSGLR